MTLESSFADQQQLADTRRSAYSRMSGRTRVVEVLIAVGLVAAVAVLWWVSPPHRFALTAGLLSLGAIVLATRVRFETAFGFTVASQLAFVPLLFSVPLALVVPAVVLALCISRLVDLFTGEVRLDSLLRVPANAWFAVGPAAVFAIAGVAPRHAGAWLLLAALVAQFAVDAAVSAIRLCIGRRASLRSQLGETWVYGVDAALSGVGLVVAEEAHRSPLAVLAVIPLLGLLTMFARERRGRLDSLLELNDTYRGTALLLGDVITADDDYTGEHSRGVVGLAIAVGRRLGLDSERRRNLEFGALLHDVGKIAIPKEIINKPGRLDPDEWELIKTHTIEGERMLARVGGFMREVGLIVRSHHERWDGGGYPNGLAADLIPLEARIITACDSWNAMLTDRSYRQALAQEVAVSEMLMGSGSQFDPEVAQALLEIVTADAAARAVPAVPALPPAVGVSTPQPAAPRPVGAVGPRGH